MNAPANIHKPTQSGAISRKILIVLSIPLVIAAVVIGLRGVTRHNHERARADWKAATLPRLAGLSITNDQIREELEELKPRPTPNPGKDWANEHVLMMTNGEYLIYGFWHGFNSGFVDHLFLAHGSDGRWLYSTYHFCNQMVGVRFDDPPGSITEFARKYSAREFDGKSDECLKKTWPPKK